MRKLTVSGMIAQLPANVVTQLEVTNLRPLLERILAVLTGDERFLGAWLWGSLSRGEGDASSDLDLYVVVTDADHPVLVAKWEESVERITPTLSKVLRPFGNTPILAVLTTAWQRFDLILVPLSEIGQPRQQPWLLLFDRADVHQRLGPVNSAPVVGPDRLLPLIENFYWVLGMLPVPLGRRDFQLGIEGLMLQRRALIDLMLAENGSTYGGLFWRHRELTVEQRHLLDTLPPLAATRESVMAGYLACWEIFRPLARRLADRHGLTYPDQLEYATLAHLRKNLGVPFVAETPPRSRDGW